MANLNCRIDADAKIVHLIFDAKVLYEEWVATMLEIFAQPDYRPGFGFLIDRRHSIPPSTEDVHRMANFIDKHREQCNRGRFAFLTANIADYGMVRMAQGLSSDHPTELKIFQDIDLALGWLKESR